jgi:hypothetical protein
MKFGVPNLRIWHRSLIIVNNFNASRQGRNENIILLLRKSHSHSYNLSAKKDVAAFPFIAC